MDRTERLGVAGLLALCLVALVGWGSLGAYVLTRSPSATADATQAGGTPAADDQGDQDGEDNQGQPANAKARAHVNGVVTAIDGSTLTVMAQAGRTRTVVVTDATLYQLRGNRTGTLADVVVGSKVGIDGRLADGVLTATLVKVKR
jgi:hypothetical protein